MDAVFDTAFPLSYRDQVLQFPYPLFPPPSTNAKSPHVHSLTRLLVTLSSPSLAAPFLKSLAPREKLLAYQFTFDLVEGGHKTSWRVYGMTYLRERPSVRFFDFSSLAHANL